MVLIRVPARTTGGAGGTAIFYAGGGFFTNATDTVPIFFSMFSYQHQRGLTESNTEAEIFDALTITAYGISIATNTKATNSTSRCRDDNVDVPNTTVTITASTTGWFEVIGISETMAVNSAVGLEAEGTAGGSLGVRTTLTRLNL